MSDTPRTDALTFRLAVSKLPIEEHWRKYGAAMVEHARTLERELAERDSREYVPSEPKRLSWQAEAYIVLGDLRDQMRPEIVRAIQDFIGPIPEHDAASREERKP